jgi:hypothetical protein
MYIVVIHLHRKSWDRLELGIEMGSDEGTIEVKYLCGRGLQEARG